LQPVLDALIAQFTADRPRIKVELASDPNVVQKALQLHVAGTTADLVDWARNGYDLRDSIVDLKPMMTRDKIAPSIFLPSAAELMAHDGKFMGIPVSISADALIYNPALFQRAGLSVPPVNSADKSWTMEAFQQTAANLTQRPDRFGWGSHLSGGFEWMDAGTYFGVGPFDESSGKLLVNTADFQRALQYWLNLSQRLQVAPTAEETAAMGGTASQFATGKIGMDVVFSLPAKLQFTPALGTLPYSGTGKNVSARISPGSLFAGKARQIDAAWEYLKWIVEPAHDAAMAGALGHVVTGVAKAADTRRQEFQKQSGIDAQAWILQAATSRFVGWGLYKYPQVETVARAEIDPRYRSEVVTGKMAVPEFCAYIEQQLKQAIAAGL
jgi:multiple sugar transport system substrate-binding protein